MLMLLVSCKSCFHNMFTKILYPMLQVVVSLGRHSQYKNVKFIRMLHLCSPEKQQ